MRALFIYWKVLPEQLAGALHAARLFQRGVQQQHPALAAQLYQRADTSDATVTLMETYTLPGGLDAHQHGVTFMAVGKAHADFLRA